jgi:hypothetical protein
MRLPRYRVRTLLISVGVMAVLLGGGLEYLRLKRLSERYRYLAWGYGENVRSNLQGLAQLKPRLQKLRRSADADAARLEALALKIRSLQAEVALNANLVQIYEHAARHPWEKSPQVAEATSSPERFPIVQRFLTGPAAPPPPGPGDPSPPPVAGPPAQAPPIAPPAPSE